MMLQPDEKGIWPEGFVKDASWRAAMFVCARTTSKKTGEVTTCQSEFNQRWKHLPIVQTAIVQGWGGELRGHLRLLVTKKILTGEPYGDVAKLLPDQKWINERKKHAEQIWHAKQCREKIREEHGTIWNYLKTKRPRPGRGTPIRAAEYQIDTE